MIIKVNIIKENDTDIVAKIVLIDEEERVLLLKRSDYTKKHSGEWDLPGGHMRENEPLMDGLTREIKEETSLKIKNPLFITKKGTKYFFLAKYDSQPIKLSHEHTDYKFFTKNELNVNNMFEKIAFDVLEKL